MHCGYNKLASHLAVKGNAMVFLPTYTDGTANAWFDDKLDKWIGFDFDTPMFTNSQARKDQNQLRHNETFSVAKYIQNNLQYVSE